MSRYMLRWAEREAGAECAVQRSRYMPKLMAKVSLRAIASRHYVTLRLVLVLACVGALSACTTLSYYAQSVTGQYELLHKRRSIEAMLADQHTPAALRQRLALALRIREYAASALALPDNASYRSYTDLQRPFVAWNVFATPEFSLEPLRWCFPLVGCLSYRGYFARADARTFGEHLRKRGYDVFIGPVPAYSTLGWFDDPLLNTMMNRPNPELAGLLFHELAHQKLYVKGDSAFNESFATTVEREGVRRWMLATAHPQHYQAYLQRRAHEARFIHLVLAVRGQLARLYASGSDEYAMRIKKKAIFAGMRAQYRDLRREWGGYGYFDAWMAQKLNNAQIASVATYNRFVPAFEALLARYDGNLSEFYAAAKRIADMPRAERHAYLRDLRPEVAQPSQRRRAKARKRS